LFQNFGIDKIQEAVLSNSKYFIDRLAEIGINAILKNVENKNRAGIVSFRHEEANTLFQKLEESKIFCAVREGMIRFSPHFYNTQEEIEKVIFELEKFTTG
jgi:selenocysteine lyase/cysteine desulfurase